jgi:hypothetical protein
LIDPVASGAASSTNAHSCSTTAACQSPKPSMYAAIVLPDAVVFLVAFFLVVGIT